MGETFAVTELWRYPVKSMGGEALAEAAVQARGLAHDRRWMLVDAAGRFLTQREHPALTQWTSQAVPGGLRLTHRPSGTTRLIAEPPPDAERVAATVWDDALPLALADAEDSAWIAEHMEGDVRLVHQPADAIRPVSPERATPGDHVSLADGYPLLVTTTASLADLNRRIEERGGEPVPMDRFRPNLVLATDEPFAEDRWRALDIGGVRLRLTHPCKRCVVTTTDQRSGARGKEPLRTLATFRRDGSHVLFGMNAIPERLGTMRVGDEARVAG